MYQNIFRTYIKIFRKYIFRITPKCFKNHTKTVNKILLIISKLAYFSQNSNLSSKKNNWYVGIMRKLKTPSKHPYVGVF